MFKRKILVLLAATAAVVAIGAGAIAVGAQSQEGTGTSFLDRVAAKLGIDTPKLEQAIKDTRSEDIDKAVADGVLTQERADALKQRLEDLPLDGPGPFGGFGHGKGFGMEFRDGPGEFRFGFFGPGFNMEDAQQKLADYMGISVDQLKTELQADTATLATVAEAHGKSRDDLKTFIRTEGKAKLDEAVAGGTLTQTQADDMLTKLDAHVDMLLDHPLFGGRHIRPFGRFPDLDDGADESDDGTAVPQQGGTLIVPARSS